MTKTTASPLSLTSNTLTIDLSNYATISTNSTTFQPKLTVTTSLASPLIFTNNNLSIDLSGYYQTSSNTLAQIYFDGNKNTCVYLDNYYRVFSDTINFYVQRVIELIHNS